MHPLRRLPVFVTLTLLGLATLASPAAADDATACTTASDDLAIIDACTRVIIAGGRNLSWEYTNRGAAYINKGENDRAISDFNEAIRIDPKFANPYANRGRAYFNKGENDRAISDFSEAIRIDPKFANAYANRGRAYFNKGENDRAIFDLNEAIQINPKFEYAHYVRGVVYSGKGDNDRAIFDYDEVIKINPKFPDAYNSRGRAYLNKGDNERAITDFNEAIRINPKYAIAYSNRGEAYRQKGDKDRAIADFDEAIRIIPKFADAYNNRGSAYGDKGDYERAISDFNEAIGLNSLLTMAFTNRGLAFERLAEFKKARADFRAALSMPPKSGSDKWAHDKARERLAALPETTNDNRVALVIGNSNYDRVPALLNPERDAKLVADVLKRTGFKSVTLLINLKKDALVSALRNFAVQAETADWAVVYYAGHGMEVGGTNYLVPTDANIAADRDIDFEAVPLEQVLNAAERAKKLRLVILDACRDNPFKAKMKRTLTVASRSVSAGLAAIEPDAGTLVVYAAKDGQQASDGDGIDSPFTLAFVKNVQTPGLEVRRLFDFVRDDVMDSTKRQQQPFSYGSISGRQDFYFIAK